MKEPYEKAAVDLKGKAVLAEVDATVDEKLAQKYNVEGFPTLKLFANGKEVTDYKGDRDYESMVSFIERASKPAFETFDTAAAFDTFISDSKALSIVVGVGLDDTAKESLTTSSFSLRDLFPDSITFTAVKDPSVVASSAPGLNAGDFVLLTPPESGTGPFEVTKYDATKFDTVDKFVKIFAMPPMGEFTEENAEIYTALGTPVVVGFFNETTVMSDPNFVILKSVALKKRGNGKVNFVWANRDSLASFQEYVGLKDAKVAICGYSFEHDEKFLLAKGTEKLEAAIFESFVDDLIAGKIKPVTKSQPIPSTQPESGPLIVVGSSWVSVVEDESKDVLVAQVAPWCGYCKLIKPILERTADELRSAGIKDVLIATMDATENDAPRRYKASGFPTIHFFPAGKEAVGLDFDGGRSTKEILEYLKSKATNRFEFDTSQLADDIASREDEEGVGGDGHEEDDEEVVLDDDKVRGDDESGEHEDVDDSTAKGGEYVSFKDEL
jgi:protein disulfide-isomerase A1